MRDFGVPTLFLECKPVVIVAAVACKVGKQLKEQARNVGRMFSCESGGISHFNNKLDPVLVVKQDLHNSQEKITPLMSKLEEFRQSKESLDLLRFPNNGSLGCIAPLYDTHNSPAASSLAHHREHVKIKLRKSLIILTLCGYARVFSTGRASQPKTLSSTHDDKDPSHF